MTALTLCYLAAGVFFLGGLLSGIWKYQGILKSAEAVAPEYVNVLHRASLLYAFASILLAEFVELSNLSNSMELLGVAMAVGFFAFAQFTYLIHGILGDTDNQFLKPYRLGPWKMPGSIIHGAMVLLILGEVGGFSILFWGYLRTLI
ncbi:MAG: hypothetical protein CMF59_17335 [Leptospiraceae bacterium]|nr:hypothetical protein [Leptospiraceae bacterium]